jgi:dipeptidase E
MARKKLLLISNSIQYGQGYLDHVEDDIRGILRPRSRVAFVPYAAFDLDEYENRARERFERMGYTLESVHRHRGREPDLLGNADAVFIGGGNTFRLLARLYAFGWLEPIRTLVEQGLPYIGSSAGSIVAGPSIKTTKDMPVVEPPSFNALNLVSFHISPHYLDPDPNSIHMGETQEERILQFLEENEGQVIGLREGSWLLVSGDQVALIGPAPARLFQREASPWESPPGPILWHPMRPIHV